jgi:hypothetical protein
MWSTLAIAAALQLAPGQTGKLDLVNVRPTYGMLGAPRPSSQILPGDVFWLAFDIDNIKTDAKGKAVYSMGFEVSDKGGKPLLKEEENKDKPLVADLSLGGNRLPVFARVEVGLDQPPGEYTMKVSVTDRTAKTSASLERKFQVMPLTLGLVRLSTSYDAADPVQGPRYPAPMVAAPGQFLHVNFVAVGFERDKAKKQPNMQVELNVLDEKGKPVRDKPDMGQVSEADEKARAMPMRFALALNRPGRYTVELKATDMVTKKSSTLKFPLTVVSIEK